MQRFLGSWIFAAAAGPTLLLTSMFNAFNSRRIGLTVLLLASATLFTSFNRSSRRHVPFSAVLSLTLITCLGLASAIDSVLIGQALVEVGYYLLAVAAIWLIAAASDAGQASRGTTLVALAFILPISLYVMGAISAVASSLSHSIPLDFPEPVNGFANLRFFNQYQTWVLPFLAAALWLPTPTRYTRTFLWHALVFVVAAFFWALLLRTHGRGTLYATAGATMIVAFLCGSSGRRHALATIALALAGFAITALMFGFGFPGGGESRLLSIDSPGRMYVWSLSLALIKQHPWLGIGPMHFAIIDSPEAAHPHNAPLQWAVEWGLPAASLMMACLAWLGSRWLMFARRVTQATTGEQSIWITALTASMLAGAAHSLVSGIVVMPMSQLMLILVAGLALGTWWQHHPQPLETTPSRKRQLAHTTFAALVLLAAAHVTVMTVRDLPLMLALSHGKAPESVDASRHPRYWVHGMMVRRAGKNAIAVPKSVTH